MHHSQRWPFHKNESFVLVTKGPCFSHACAHTSQESVWERERERGVGEQWSQVNGAFAFSSSQSSFKSEIIPLPYSITGGHVFQRKRNFLLRTKYAIPVFLIKIVQFRTHLSKIESLTLRACVVDEALLHMFASPVNTVTRSAQHP